MTTNRRKAHRKALHDEVRSRLVPRLLELGYESTRTRAGKAAWPEEAGKGWGYARRRGDFVDRLELRWEKYGAPWFVIDFETGRRDASYRNKSTAFGELNARYAGPIGRVLGVAGRWFGQGHDATAAIDMALSSIDQLEAYFETGDRGRQLAFSMVGGVDVHRPIPIWLGPIMILGWLIGLPIRLAAWLLRPLDRLMVSRHSQSRKARRNRR